MNQPCIFCLDTGEEVLYQNASCPCLFRTHRTCWERYIASKHPLTCPTCRKQIIPKLQLNPPPSAPSTNDFILQEDVYIPIPAEQQHSNTSSTPIRKKPTKLQTVILALVLFGLWIFVMKMFGIF